MAVPAPRAPFFAEEWPLRTPVTPLAHKPAERRAAQGSDHRGHQEQQENRIGTQRIKANGRFNRKPQDDHDRAKDGQEGQNQPRPAADHQMGQPRHRHQATGGHGGDDQNTFNHPRGPNDV